MNWIARRVWEGLAAAGIVATTAITTLQAWPTDFQWLVIAAGALGAGIKAVNAYNAEPK